MNKIAAVGVVVVLAVAGFLAIGNDNSMVQDTSGMQFSAVREQVGTTAKLYDVRTPSEYASGHIEGAENWSLQMIESGKYPAIDKASKVYVYCQSGNRSAQATRLLQQAGFTDVVDLGGVNDVQNIGGELEK